MSQAFLELRGISRRFGAKTALDTIDLEVAPGELLVVLGPTGAGKTTLLRTICGLETADSGSIAMEGREISSLSPAQRDVALVFQNFSLYPDWTVRRNLEFPLRAPGRALAEAEIRERVSRAAATLRIEALLDRPAGKLSGGEMQRVAIGRAIVRKPKLFLMDEPLTNLDAKLREALRVELSVLVRSLGVPMVYVTHDQGEALSMADRIAVLIEGRIQQVGTPREVYESPASPLVACQLGQPQINLFDAELRDGQFRAAGGTVLCPALPTAATRARLGVRPEHLEVVAASSVPENAATTVELVENAG
ncbi:MAG TPA: ABC transporter ATP-binding protein, partial [Planctomycetota bacterium]|nr:ABC transporter ATP-binding protein [Planctomycetota bacterium]